MDCARPTCSRLVTLASEYTLERTNLGTAVHRYAHRDCPPEAQGLGRWLNDLAGGGRKPLYVSSFFFLMLYAAGRDIRVDTDMDPDESGIAFVVGGESIYSQALLAGLRATEMLEARTKPQAAGWSPTDLQLASLWFADHGKAMLASLAGITSPQWLLGDHARGFLGMWTGGPMRQSLELWKECLRNQVALSLEWFRDDLPLTEVLQDLAHADLASGFRFGHD